MLTRRVPYSSVSKTNRVKAANVVGMGDVVFKGFQCLNPNCQNFIFVRKDEIGEDFLIECVKCGFSHESGNQTKFYDYSMDIKEPSGQKKSVGTGEFTIFHEEYIDEAQEYKYCIICNTMKPLNYFDNHSARKSGRQGECRLCKKAYNQIKNGTRLSDQHREASQKRRILIDIAGSPKINSKTIESRFNHRCFSCGKDLSKYSDRKEKPLDHTLPVFYLWPLTTENATLLCRTCNGQKSGTWPSMFYRDEKLKQLSVITGIDYSILSGPPIFNPHAISQLKDPYTVDNLLVKHAAYMNEIIKLRNRILKLTGFDFFTSSSTISKKHIEIANKYL